MTETEPQRIIRENVSEFGKQIGKLNPADTASLNLSLSTFAFAYLKNPGTQIYGIDREEYKKMTEEIVLNEMFEGTALPENADSQRGLELMLQIGACEKSSIPGNTRLTLKGGIIAFYLLSGIEAKWNHE